MSQHTFKAVTKDGVHVDVLCGWDRPLRGFFLVVEKEGAEDDTYLFSNLELPPDESHPDSFEPFENALNELGIAIPDGLVEALEIDQVFNAGNSYKNWSASLDDAKTAS